MRHQITLTAGRVLAAAAAAALSSLALPSVVDGQTASPGGQILRPRQGGETSILEIDRVARLTLRLPVAPSAAFDAWTVAEQLVEWFPHWAEMTVAEGEAFSMGWEGYEGAWEGTYLEVDRPSTLAFTWRAPASAGPIAEQETVVRLTFQETEDERTVMVLEHSGFADAAAMEAQLQSWRPHLFALRAFLLQPPSGTRR